MSFRRGMQRSAWWSGSPHGEYFSTIFILSLPKLSREPFARSNVRQSVQPGFVIVRWSAPLSCHRPMVSGRRVAPKVQGAPLPASLQIFAPAPQPQHYLGNRRVSKTITSMLRITHGESLRSLCSLIAFSPPSCLPSTWPSHSRMSRTKSGWYISRTGSPQGSQSLLRGIQSPSKGRTCARSTQTEA